MIMMFIVERTEQVFQDIKPLTLIIISFISTTTHNLHHPQSAPNYILYYKNLSKNDINLWKLYDLNFAIGEKYEAFDESRKGLKHFLCVCVCLYWDTIPVVIFILEKFPSPSTHTAPVVLVFHLNFILNRMNWGWRMAGYDNRIYA